MTGRRKFPTDRRRTGATRRGFLALAGTAALAGCNALDGVTDEEPPTIDGSDFEDALSGDPPTVTETIPVEVEPSYLDGTAESTRAYLSSVPAPLDAEEVPNGAIRAELSRSYEDTNEELDDARDAPSPAETMARLRDARASARGVAATWAAIDEGLTREEVLTEVPEIRESVDDFRQRWRYVGEGPIRAVLVHGQVEELVAYAYNASASARERSRHESDNPITVGELADHIEEARAALDDAEYLYGRYADSLAEPNGIRKGLVAAGEELSATLDDRRADLPDAESDDSSEFVDRDIEGTPVGTALGDLHRGLDYADGLDDERATGRRASVVLSAHETLVRARAFEALRERVSNGDHVTVESAEDVRTIRNRAFEAVEAALESGDDLTRRLLSEIGGDFSYVEDELGRYEDRDEVTVSWLDRELGIYVQIGAMARAAPAVSDEVASVLDEHF